MGINDKVEKKEYNGVTNEDKQAKENGFQNIFDYLEEK